MAQLEQEHQPQPVRRRRRKTHTKLVSLRINEGLTPNDLARRAGVSGQVVRMAEAGYIPGPRIQFAIAGVFKHEVEDRALRPLEIWPIERQI